MEDAARNTDSRGGQWKHPEWGYEIAKIPAAASLSLYGLVGMMWTDGANHNDLMWLHMSGGSLCVDFKSETKNWPKTIHCDGIMAYL